MSADDSLWQENPKFRAWVESLPDKHWAKYDLSACRLGWEAGRKDALSRLDTAETALRPFAEAAGQVPNGHGPDNEPVGDDEPVTITIVGVQVGEVTAADLERARAALTEKKP